MYAVLVGRERKVVETWEECKKLTKGFPRNKFQRVGSPEEGQKLIDDYINNSVEKTGFEDKKYHIYSSVAKSNRTPNVVITLRSVQGVKGFGHFKKPYSQVTCVIQSPKELGLPIARDVMSWDKRPRYIYDLVFTGLYAEKYTSIWLALSKLFNILRLKYDDLSILLNTDSNLVLHSLHKNIFRSLEVVTVTDVLYQDALMSLYLQISTFDGLVLNYEAGDRVSGEGHYASLYLKGEYDIYAERA